MLKWLVFLPVFGALAVGGWPGWSGARRWRIAVFFALLTVVWSGSLVLAYDPGGPAFQFVESRAWNARLGSYFALGVDGLALAMLVLTSVLTLVALLMSRQIAQGARLYFTLVMLLESAILGVFAARDWSLFYVFWEATLIPLFFLIDRLGGEGRQRAALNFFLYTLGGSVFMLVALLFLYDAAPGHSFAMADMAAGGLLLPEQMQWLIFIGLALGFGVKLPVVPLHGWLPLAHVEAPSPISILLSGVLLKMGGYGLLRAAETLPAAIPLAQTLLAALALLALLYGGILAWRQQDLKAMVAYSSISHMGLVLLGLATHTRTGLTGAVLQMLAHGLTAAFLFLLVGALYQRTHQRDLAAYGSLARTAPRFAFFIAFALLAALGFPASLGFVAELHLLLAAWAQWGGWALALGLAMVISAAAALRCLARLVLAGPPMEIADLTRSETLAASGLAFGVLVLGLWPQPLLDLLAPSMQRLAALWGG